MDYHFEQGDDEGLIARLVRHFTTYVEPIDVQIALRDDPIWEYLRLDLQLAANRLLRLELEEIRRNSSHVLLCEMQPRGEATTRLPQLSADEKKLWRAVTTHPSVPPSLEVIVRDFLLSSAADATPLNADRVIELYRLVAQGPHDTLHVGLAVLRANTIARSRGMEVESEIRNDMLRLGERVFLENVFPGIALRHVAAVAERPRNGIRAPDELSRIERVISRIESEHHDASTIDWVAKIRLLAADTDQERDAVRRDHVKKFIGISDQDTEPIRAIIWAERAVALASDYGIQDLHDAAVVRMQRLSRTDLGWHHQAQEIAIPVAMIHQRERLSAQVSSWEQGLATFLAGDSPSGNIENVRRQAATGRHWPPRYPSPFWRSNLRGTSAA